MQTGMQSGMQSRMQSGMQSGMQSAAKWAAKSVMPEAEKYWGASSNRGEYIICPPRLELGYLIC